MRFYSLVLAICASMVYVSAYTDPSVVNPQLVKRFEYKLSFKGPHLSFKDGSVPFWSFGGSKCDLNIVRRDAYRRVSSRRDR